MSGQDDHEETERVSPAADRLQDWARQWIDSRDESAARSLMEALHPCVAAVVAGHAPRGVDPDDLKQEVFLRLFRALPRYRPNRPLEHWASRIALNVCRNSARGAGRKPLLRWSDLTEGERTAFEYAAGDADETDPSCAVSAADARDLIRRVIDSLGAADRQIVILLHLEERSVGEIASLMGMPRAVVRVRAFRARLRMRRLLTELDGTNRTSGP